MADRVAVMKGGKLQAFAPPDELYDKPRTLFVAGFVGNPPMNFINVEVSRENGDYLARGDGIELKIQPEQGEKVAGKGQVIMGIRPEDITVVSEGTRGEIYMVEPLGRDDLINVRLGEDVIIHVLSDPALNLKMNDPIALEINTNKMQFFDPKSEQSLLWT